MRRFGSVGSLAIDPLSLTGARPRNQVGDAASAPSWSSIAAVVVVAVVAAIRCPVSQRRALAAVVARLASTRVSLNPVRAPAIAAVRRSALGPLPLRPPGGRKARPSHGRARGRASRLRPRLVGEPQA